jgi:hypothetical protein
MQMRFAGMVMAAMLLMGAAAARAADGPLPSFQVQTRDKRPVSSADIAPEQKWLLVYVSPNCRSCETLVRALPKWQSAALLARTVLVVGGPTGEASAWVDRMIAPELPTLIWYADPQGAAHAALELTGAPVLLGIERGEVQWQLGGVLNSPAALESVVRSWVER